MAHKTLINGTAYDISGGRELVNGTGYAKKKGRVLVNGTGYDIPFSSGIPIGTLPAGSVVKIGVNGKAYDFLVVNQGIPSNSSLYDSSCDGTWLLMNVIYESRKWNNTRANGYEGSDIHSYLNNTFINLFDSNVRDAIKQIKIPYCNGYTGGNEIKKGANGLLCKLFLLAAYEVGWTVMDYEYTPVDGAKLDFFGASSGGDYKRIAKHDGQDYPWWLRSPRENITVNAVRVLSTGGYSGYGVTSNSGVRPAFTLPATFPVIQNPDCTYSPAA